MKRTELTVLINERDRLAIELRLHRRGQFHLQHRLDILNSAIAKITAMPTADISLPSLGLFGGRRKRKKPI